jgi:two-component system OmpR family sensor kinase
VLTLAREGKSIGETEPVDLAENARTAWGHVETDNARLVVDDEGTIEADSDRLLQLFENLFRNAVEHAVPEEPMTRGSAATAGGRVPDGDGSSQAGGHTAPGEEGLTVTVGVDDVLYVEDDGQGIPEDERDDVLDAGYTTSRDGTGFGLSIVTQIAEAHGWTVEVTDGREGGARFEFAGVEPIE